MESMMGMILRSARLENNFKMATLVDSDHQVRWLPILRCGDRDMGCDVNGTWAVEERFGLRMLDNPHSFGRVVVLLEQPWSSVESEIETFFLRFGVHVAARAIFPIRDVVRAGLEFGSSYWAELAMTWYGELPPDDRVSMRAALQAVCEAKWASQKVRQLAQRELRTL